MPSWVESTVNRYRRPHRIISDSSHVRGWLILSEVVCRCCRHWWGVDATHLSPLRPAPLPTLPVTADSSRHTRSSAAGAEEGGGGGRRRGLRGRGDATQPPTSKPQHPERSGHSEYSTLLGTQDKGTGHISQGLTPVGGGGTTTRPFRSHRHQAAPITDGHHHHQPPAHSAPG